MRDKESQIYIAEERTTTSLLTFFSVSPRMISCVFFRWQPQVGLFDILGSEGQRDQIFKGRKPKEEKNNEGKELKKERKKRREGKSMVLNSIYVYVFLEFRVRIFFFLRMTNRFPFLSLFSFPSIEFWLWLSFFLLSFFFFLRFHGLSSCLQ